MHQACQLTGLKNENKQKNMNRNTEINKTRAITGCYKYTAYPDIGTGKGGYMHILEFGKKGA